MAKIGAIDNRPSKNRKSKNRFSFIKKLLLNRSIVIDILKIEKRSIFRSRFNRSHISIFFVSIYIDILTKNIDNINMYVSIFFPVIKNHATVANFSWFLGTTTGELICQRRTQFLHRRCSVSVAQRSNGAMSGQATLDAVMAICKGQTP